MWVFFFSVVVALPHDGGGQADGGTCTADALFHTGGAHAELRSPSSSSWSFPCLLAQADATANESAAVRDVQRIIESVRTFEGAGFPVERPFPTREMSYFDPFLLLDHFGPVNYGPDEAVGAPWHPHRGCVHHRHLPRASRAHHRRHLVVALIVRFETVSVMLQGEFQHSDSAGNRGLLRAGDVQWMTAGSGVIHDEAPSPAFRKTGGVMEGFQVGAPLIIATILEPPRWGWTRACDN